MIVKKKGGYEVVSKKKNKKGKHKNLGFSRSLSGAKKRLRQVEFFKRHKSQSSRLIEKAIKNILGLP